jgi:branched-chain amino acid transport system permease protein
VKPVPDVLAPVWRVWTGVTKNASTPAKVARFVAAIIFGLIAVEQTFHLRINELLNGACTGLLYGLIAVGIILIYKTNRIINFAAAAIGAVPAIFALLLDVQRHVNYLVVLPIALIGGLVFGGLVDVLIMRRFATSPRLIVTVVTIGIAQGFAAVGFFIPIWIGATAGKVAQVPTPWDGVTWNNAQGQPVLTGNQIAAIVVTLVVSVGLGLFLRYTRIGIALRASAENSDRAALLGIPVKRVQTAAWMLAGLLASMAIYFQSPLIGVPSNATLGFDALLYALAAAVVARMERIGVALAVGTFVGIIQFGVVSRTGTSTNVGAYMLVLILVALLLQRKSQARALDAGTSSWDVVRNFRPIPAELRNLPEVNTARYLLVAAAGAAALLLPLLVGHNDMPKLIPLPLYGMIGVSLVVLTGWAGQISLGQFGLVGVGAAVSGGLVFNHDADFFVAVFAGIAAGVVAAILIGLPAVRIQGLYLAVTTLAFAYACNGFVLDRTTWIGERLLPKGLVPTFKRPVLYGRFDLENDRTYYYVCVVALLISVVAALAFRRNRSGRVLIAARDNQRAAPAYGINLVRTRLAAFAVSGAIAGLAGALFAYDQHQVIPDTYSVGESITVFLVAVIGGLTSVPAAVLGLVSYEALVQFGPNLYKRLGPNFVTVVPQLLTGPLLLANLYQYPGGIAEILFERRDRFLRWVARRHDILVPSLIADRRVENENLSGELITQAQRHVEQAATVATEAVVACPVCGSNLSLLDAAEHEHLRVPSPS